MAITVVSAASSRQLTTVARVKDELGITASTYDTLLGRMIDQASDAITSYCGRYFAQETFKETMPCKGSYNLILSRTPVVSITHVKYKGTALTDTTDYILVEPEAGIIMGTSPFYNTGLATNGIGGLIHPSSYAYDYEVQYVAGYILPSMVGTVTLPANIEKAAIELTKSSFLSRKLDPNIESESVPDVGSIKYRVSGDSSSLPPTVTAMLEAYRRLL